MNQNYYYLLAFVGGGCKGLISARILERLVESGHLKIENGMILAGTSTGAIIVALIAKGYTPKQIVDFYLEYGNDIFDKEFLRFGITRSKYDDSEFNRLLKEFLGNTTLGDIRKKGIHIVIPCYNATKRTRVIFRSSVEKYDGMRLRDVVRASASAPTYFDPVLINGDVIVDGGLAVNNGTQVAHLDAMRCGKKVKFITCVGTGRIEEPLTERQLKNGILANAVDLFNLVLTEQDKTTHFFMDEYKDFFGYDYKRIDPVLNHSSGDIDDFSRENNEAMLRDANETRI